MFIYEMPESLSTTPRESCCEWQSLISPNIDSDDEEYQLIMHHELSKAIDTLGGLNNKIYKADNMATEFLDDFKKHKILARFHGGVYRGRVWDSEGKLVKEMSGESLNAVVEQLKMYVTNAVNQLIESRTAPLEVSQYVDAFQTIIADLPETYLAMLKAHYYAADRTLTARELAKATGIYKDWNTVNLHYGLLGKRLHDELLIDLPRRENGELIYTCMLATEGDHNHDESEWQWKMRPEVARAIEILKLF